MMAYLEPLALVAMAALAIYLVFRRRRRPACGPSTPAGGCARCPMKGECPAILSIEPLPRSPEDSRGNGHDPTESAHRDT